MKYIVVILIALGIGYYLFQPSVDKLFNKITGQYTKDVERNRELSQ